MNATWHVLTLVSVLSCAEPRCSSTSFYKNCWIRRFPGLYIDVEESLRRGAHLLRAYPEDTALKCSRSCCLTRNFSCNLAVFHYDTTQESVNCFHLHCPSLESCILSHRQNVVLYNITDGVDPDLLVFGKYFNTNVRVLPHHYSRSNASDPLPPDKRQFIHPHPRPRPAPRPLPRTTVPAITTGPEPTHTVTSSEHVTYGQETTASAATSGVKASSIVTRIESPKSESEYSDMATATPLETPLYTTAIPPLTTPTFKTQLSTSISAKSAHTTFPTSLSPDSSSQIHNGSSPESSKPKANDTKWSQGRNHSVVGEDSQDQDQDQDQGGDPWGELGPGWHVATHTALVAVAICVTLLLGCCCSLVLVFGWRGHRKRMGHYRTAWRGKRGSMRLVKYVLVKENS